MNFILDKIRRRSREEWQGYFSDSLTEARIWMQENSEKAALVGLALGVLIGLNFKFFLLLVLLALVAFFLIWLLSEPKSAMSDTNTFEVRNTDSGADTVVRTSTSESNGDNQTY